MPDPIIIQPIITGFNPNPAITAAYLEQRAVVALELPKLVEALDAAFYEGAFVTAEIPPAEAAAAAYADSVLATQTGAFAVKMSVGSFLNLLALAATVVQITLDQWTTAIDATIDWPPKPIDQTVLPTPFVMSTNNLASPFVVGPQGNLIPNPNYRQPLPFTPPPSIDAVANTLAPYYFNTTQPVPMITNPTGPSQ